MLYYGKKTWYKKSSGRTFSRQGSSSTNWDLVGRELATLDELSKIPKGNCILFISTVGAFYSKLYNLKKHPNYADLMLKSGQKIDLNKQIEKIELKQGLGDAYLFVYYKNEDKVFETMIDDGEEIGNYIRKQGENADLFFEVILKFLVRIIPIDILLIVVNEISYMITKRKSKIS